MQSLLLTLIFKQELYDVGRLSSVQRDERYCNIGKCIKIGDFILECKTLCNLHTK